MFLQDLEEPAVPSSSTFEKEPLAKDEDGWGDDDAWEDFDSGPAIPEPHRTTAKPLKLHPRTPTPDFFDSGANFTSKVMKERQQQQPKQQRERTPPPPVPATLFAAQEGGGDDDGGWGDWEDTSFGSHGSTVKAQQSCRCVPRVDYVNSFFLFGPTDEGEESTTIPNREQKR